MHGYKHLNTIVYSIDDFVESGVLCNIEGL